MWPDVTVLALEVSGIRGHYPSLSPSLLGSRLMLPACGVRARWPVASPVYCASLWPSCAGACFMVLTPTVCALIAARASEENNPSYVWCREGGHLPNIYRLQRSQQSTLLGTFCTISSWTGRGPSRSCHFLCGRGLPTQDRSRRWLIRHNTVLDTYCTTANCPARVVPHLKTAVGRSEREHSPRSQRNYGPLPGSLCRIRVRVR